MGQWVRYWVFPHIASRFDALAGRLLQFLVTSPGIGFVAAKGFYARLQRAAGNGPPGFPRNAVDSLMLLIR